MRYIVSIPMTGYVSVQVDTESSAEAISKAWKKVSDSEGFLSFQNDKEIDLSAYEYHSEVARGNIFSGVLNQIEVEEVE